MIFGGDAFRYVIFPSSRYANVYSATITFRTFIPTMASTYKRIIFLTSLLTLAAILPFFTFTRLLLQLSLTISPLHLSVLTLSPTDAIKRAQLFTVSCNDRYQRLQFVQAIITCYVINSQQFELTLLVM